MTRANRARTYIPFLLILPILFFQNCSPSYRVGDDQSLAQGAGEEDVLSPTPSPSPTPGPTPTPTPTPAPVGLAAPTGYSSAHLIFEDRFTSAKLDTTKWNPWMGEDVYGRWGNKGNLPAPYSAHNAGGFQIQHFDPYPYGHSVNTSGDRLVGGNGVLSFIASPSNYFFNQGYTWASSAVSTYGKAYLPATGGYIQIRAKMPDTRYGAWPGIWLMPNAGSDGKEFDLHEGGYFANGAPSSNYVLAAHWWGGAANQIIKNTGVDLSADYHIYGVDYRPGQYWRVYLDGKLMAEWTTGISTNAKYELILDIEMAGSQTTGWHTVADAVKNPGPFRMDVTDVQIYRAP